MNLWNRPSPLLPVHREISLLSSEEKWYAIAILFQLISFFLPWFTVEIGSGQSLEVTTWYGFSGLAAAIGWFSLLFSLFALFLLWTKAKRKQIVWIENNRAKWYFGLAAQSFFILILAMLVYSAYGVNYSTAEVRFGLWTGILAAVCSLGISYLSIVHAKKEAAKELFVAPKMNHASLTPEKIGIQGSPEEEEPRQMNFSEYDERKKTDVYSK